MALGDRWCEMCGEKYDRLTSPSGLVCEPCFDNLDLEIEAWMLNSHPARKTVDVPTRGYL